MKKVVKLKESDLQRIVKRVLNEESNKRMLGEQEDELEYKVRYVFYPNITLGPSPKQKYVYLMREKGEGNDDWVEVFGMEKMREKEKQQKYKEIPFEEEFNIDELDRMYVRQKNDGYPKYRSEPYYITNEKDRKAIMFWRGEETEVFTL